jgi:hypothetical protein
VIALLCECRECDELLQIRYDVKRHKFHGVGVVPVQRTKREIYVFVLKSTIPEEYCYRHPTEQMVLKQVRNGLVFHKDTFFSQCEIEIGARCATGRKTLCRDNVYPLYPFDRLQQQMANADPDQRPVLIELNV